MTQCVLDSSNKTLSELIKGAKVLVVGAGGIGCELLKNLVLTGFTKIQIIDLDTIDVSNLNRQFLFRKQHVGKSKAIVAKESALLFKEKVDIKAHHDNITNPRYDVEYFRQFSLVMNALDNRAARSHVNRMCLAADVPLIESGTAGYLGQVTVIKKGLTECYECQPKTAEKTFPGCTIRNTPSEPIHCIVWAKHLFNQLFGEADPDEDVSPDMADPELAGETIVDRVLSKMDEKGCMQRVSTRVWAMNSSYNPEKIFNKLFHDDIQYLLSMDKLWLERRPPQPLKWNKLPDAVAGSSGDSQALIRDQNVWSISECGNFFKKSLEKLKSRIESEQPGSDVNLVWDKDDEECMDFVTACANVRSYCFGIPQKSRFDVKSMAGNIVPAIATTNAVIAGLVVLQALKILEGAIEECASVFLCKEAQSVGKLLASCRLVKPKPDCYVCSSKPEVEVFLNTGSCTVRMLEEKILKGHLHMVAPDVEIDDGKGTILISSEEGETEENKDKMLNIFGVRNGTRLKCDDFRQNYMLVVIINQCEQLPNQQEFIVKGEVGKPLEEPPKNHEANDKLNGTCVSMEVVDDDEDVLIVDDQPRKRKQNEDSDESSEKRARHDSDTEAL